MMRRRLVIGGAAVIAAVVVLGATVVSCVSDDAASASDSAVTTAEVVKTDLVSRKDVDGTLGYAHSYTVVAEGDGRLTWLPEVGATIRRGERVYGVDGESVPLFHGSIPIYRKLSDGVSDGEDVQELEKNLEALGYGTDLTVDKTFTSVTSAAIVEWQEDLGLDETGVVAPGDVVIAAGDLLVSSIKGVLGAAAKGPVLTATDTTRQVTVDLPVTQQELAVVDSAVRIKLPGGKTTTGKVSSIGTTASSGNGNGSGSGDGQAQTGQGTETATIPVYVTLDDPDAAGKLDGAPVTVGFTSATHKGVLAVPVSALLANPDGSYAVKVVKGSRRSLVTVELGIFADGRVEVSGEGLSAGMRVEVPKS
jgi:peptidoglycan hydrolase-like protein with peptidoglycan-binding domain